MKTDAVYARQSVEKKDSLSIAGQIDLCHRTADGGELRVYKDAGYSGKNTERPAFQQLMKDIRALFSRRASSPQARGSCANHQ